MRTSTITLLAFGAIVAAIAPVSAQAQVASPAVASHDVSSLVRKADGTYQMTVVTMGTKGLVSRSWRLDTHSWDDEWTELGQPSGAPVRATTPGVDGVDTRLPILPGWDGDVDEVGTYFAFRAGAASVASVDLDLAAGSRTWVKRTPPAAVRAKPQAIWELRESESGTAQWIDHGTPAPANSCILPMPTNDVDLPGLDLIEVGDISIGDGLDEIADYDEDTYVECLDFPGNPGNCPEEPEPDEGWSIHDEWEAPFEAAPAGGGTTLATFFRPMVALETSNAGGGVRHVFGTGSLVYRTAPASAIRVAGKDHVFVTDGQDVIYLASTNGTTWTAASLGAPPGAILGAPVALQRDFTVVAPGGAIRTVHWAAVLVVAYDPATARNQVFYSRFFEGQGWACWQRFGDAPVLGAFELTGAVAYFAGASTRDTALRVSLFGHTADGQVVRVWTADGDEVFFEQRAAPGPGIEVTAAAVIDTASFEQVCAFARDDAGEVHALCGEAPGSYRWESLRD